MFFLIYIMICLANLFEKFFKRASFAGERRKAIHERPCARVQGDELRFVSAMCTAGSHI